MQYTSTQAPDMALIQPSAKSSSISTVSLGYLRLCLVQFVWRSSRNGYDQQMMTITKSRPSRESAMRTIRVRNVPTLSQMIRDGQESAAKIRRATKEALLEWFDQSERLNIARIHYKLRGTRFTDFARRIGVDRSSAFELVKLHKHRAAILSGCRDERDKAISRGECYFYPGWRTALERVQGNQLDGRWPTYLFRELPETAARGPAHKPRVFLYEGDSLSLLRAMPDSVKADVCITSPPYFQKFDYQHDGQYGLESSVERYLQVQIAVFHEVQRLLCEGGTCFIVIGDTSNNYSPIRAKGQRKGGDKQWLARRSLEVGYREKEALNIPLRLAEALRKDGWIHRATLIWDKIGGSSVANSDATPECHEYVLHMIKWSFKKRRPYGNTKPLKSSVLRHQTVAHPMHGCVFPVSLVEELLSICPARPTILDPYIGSGTVAIAAQNLPGSTVYGFDLNCSTAKQVVPCSPPDRH
jgi:DNA modification methylase